MNEALRNRNLLEELRIFKTSSYSHENEGYSTKGQNLYKITPKINLLLLRKMY